MRNAISPLCRGARQAVVVVAYASRDNLAQAKALGVHYMAFHKKAGLRIKDMVKSNWVYRKLRNFRAGIEFDISCLKRAFGLARCVWRGLDHFRAYVWSSVVAYRPRSLRPAEAGLASPHSPAPSPRLAEPGSNSNSDFQKIYGWIGPLDTTQQTKWRPNDPVHRPTRYRFPGQKIMRLWTDTRLAFRNLIIALRSAN